MGEEGEKRREEAEKRKENRGERRKKREIEILHALTEVVVMKATIYTNTGLVNLLYTLLYAP